LLPQLKDHMHYPSSILWSLLIAFVALVSCNEPSLIGSDLLEDDRINVAFTDTLTMIGSQRTTDSLQTFGPAVNQQLDSYLFGIYEDPSFGTASSVITAEARMDIDPPDFENAVLDSIVLSLPYTGNYYGLINEPGQPFTMEVRLLEEQLDPEADYYSNQTFSSSELIGTRTFQPAPEDSVTIFLYGESGEGELDLGPQLRIRLDDAFGQQLISQDPSVFSNDTTFLQTYPGIQLIPTSTNKGMVAFDLTDVAAGITVFYRVDTVFNAYTFEFNSSSVKTVTYNNDPTGSLLDNFLQNPELSDSLLFIQGMTGVSAVLEIPYAENFQDRLINQAILEMTVIYPDGIGEDDYPPVEQIIVSEIQDDSTLTVIPDVSFSLSSNNLVGNFGGVPIESPSGQGIVYQMNLSAYLKELRNGIAPNRIQITAFPRAETASRVILCGPNHPEFPAKLKVSYTTY
jgi:hypothetical protein